jgi:tetratricopeptide (TPR) repeat protein
MNERVRTSSLKRNFYARVNAGRVPVWRSGANYYFLALFCSATIFFFVWAVLYDGYDDTPWMVAAIASISFAVTMVLFREIVLRRRRDREQAARRLSHHLNEAKRLRPSQEFSEKLSIRRNDQLLAEIRTKSDAAKVLGKLPEAHQEVFELCDRYLALASTEITGARQGSPRVPALRKGAAAAAKRHRFHMLRWAELKSWLFTSLANHPGELFEKVRAAEEALDAVDRAALAYPDEAALTDSRRVLRGFLTSVSVRASIEMAEAANAKGNYAESLDHYRDALVGLQRFDDGFEDRSAIAERIRIEIARLGKITGIQY